MTAYARIATDYLEAAAAVADASAALGDAAHARAMGDLAASLRVAITRAEPDLDDAADVQAGDLDALVLDAVGAARGRTANEANPVVVVDVSGRIPRSAARRTVRILATPQQTAELVTRVLAVFTPDPDDGPSEHRALFDRTLADLREQATPRSPYPTRAETEDRIGEHGADLREDDDR